MGKQASPALVPTALMEKVNCLPQVPNLAPADRHALGRERRMLVPRAAHADWAPPAERDMPALLAASNQGRTEALVPMRHARMLASPFAFYRGAPAVMAYDLAPTPAAVMRPRSPATWASPTVSTRR